MQTFQNKIPRTYFIIIGIVLFGSTKRNEVSTSQDSLNSRPIHSDLNLDEFLELYRSDTVARNSDTLANEIINFDCAVLIYPTEEEIDEMIKKYGEEDFYIIADDNTWYQGMAIQMLDSVGIKTASVHGDSLKFKGEEKNWAFDLKRDSLSGWNIILFSRKKGPQVVSAIDLTTDEIRGYFDIKE